MTVIDPQLGAQLLAYRKARNWNQTQMAAFLTGKRGWAVTQSQVSLWENGGHLTEANARFLRRVLPKQTHDPHPKAS